MSVQRRKAKQRGKELRSKEKGRVITIGHLSDTTVSVFLGV
jgi:hypothetical protein